MREIEPGPLVTIEGLIILGIAIMLKLVTPWPPSIVVNILLPNLIGLGIVVIGLGVLISLGMGYVED